MTLGLTDQIDLVQILFVAFAAFFAGLVVYLRREDKREGYPLVGHRLRHPVVGWPAAPAPKTYRMMEGGMTQVPHLRPQERLGAQRVRDGAPIVLGSAALTAGLGAGAYVMRSAEPMRMLDGGALLMPLRLARDWDILRGETEPRGMRLIGRDYKPAGRVTDVWVDRAANILRYFEVTLDDGSGTIIVPLFMSDVRERDSEIRVKALYARQFTLVPRLVDADIITAREEDRITAFYAGGTLYADA